MKVTNLRNKPLIVLDKTMNPGESRKLADEKLSDIQHLLDEGFLLVERVKITEKKEGNHGKTI